MVKDNPFIGGPAYVKLLRDAIEDPASTARPPAGGGSQISLRFPEGHLAWFSVLAKSSGWNRNQLVQALVDVGLKQLFDALTSETIEKLRNEQVEVIMRSLRH